MLIKLSVVKYTLVSTSCNPEGKKCYLLPLFCVLNFSLCFIAQTSATIETPTTTARLLVHTLYNAMNCNDTANPGNLTIALSPFRMLQAYALIRKLWREPNCTTGDEIDFYTFDVNNRSTWRVCTAGECRHKVCRCMKFVKGKYCTKFVGKCWLLYCNLTHCDDKRGPTLHCSCNSNLSRVPVVTKQYWYDEGFETSFRPPPARWKDKPFHYEIIGENIVKLLSKAENMYLKAEDLAVRLIEWSNPKEMKSPMERSTSQNPLSTKLLRMTFRTKTTGRTTPMPTMKGISVDYIEEQLPPFFGQSPLPATTKKATTASPASTKSKMTTTLAQRTSEVESTSSTVATSKNTVVLVEKELPLNTPPSYYFGRVSEESQEDLNSEYEELYENDKWMTSEPDTAEEYIDKNGSETKSLFLTIYITLFIVTFQCNLLISQFTWF